MNLKQRSDKRGRISRFQQAIKASLKPAKKTKADKADKTNKAKANISKRTQPHLNLYANLSSRHRAKKEMRARKHAEELAKLPKNPVLRFFARLRPDRVFKAIFSRRGLKNILKFAVVCFLILVITLGGLFLYYKKDLAAINPEELAKHVQNTVNTYLDRNGEVLWEDRGSGDYRLVVKDDEISKFVRQATVAIEDKNFYNHNGVDLKGILRAVYVTLRGQAVQGGSTLTQQLIKQIYFSDEAGNRSISGIPRKIKEMILAIEVEKMYNKEQLITLYLNESPYGGRRNGIESAAQTYFGKSAKELDLTESALLAAIPNNPAVLNPYNIAGHESLLARQHHVLDAMLEMGFIDAKQCEEAKKADVLSRIKPESAQYSNLKAPWFVLEVKAQLEKKYGIKVMRQGGFTIKTTVDLKAQTIAEEAVKAGSKTFYRTHADNAALVSVDVETGQIIAMVGSYDWQKPGYGQVNAATSLLEPASSIKPILDYAPLFMERSGVNYGPGSVLTDNNIDSIYCRGSFGNCRLRNYSGLFYGNVPIRRSLAGSLNIPAVKALYINGVENSLKVARALGDHSLCANGETAGLSAAIGGGCAVRPVEHANAYASLARGGRYKPLSYWLEVKNATGEVIDKWQDSAGERVLDEQAAYLVTDILSDPSARVFTFGRYLAYHPGFYNPRVWFAAKTGTSDNGMGAAKDSWICSYSPVLATAIWAGRHDGSALANGDHDVVFSINQNYLAKVHEQVYGPNGKWHAGMKIERPAGIKRMTIAGHTDIWPSWFNKSKSNFNEEKLTFDSISKKRATNCTPEETKVQVPVTKTTDPMTKKTVVFAGDYDYEREDDVHKCSDVRPKISLSVTKLSGSTSSDPGQSGANAQNNQAGNSQDSSRWQIEARIEFGTFELASYELKVAGESVKTGNLAGSSDTVSFISDKPGEVSLRVSDVGGYVTTASDTLR